MKKQTSQPHRAGSVDSAQSDPAHTTPPAHSDFPYSDKYGFVKHHGGLGTVFSSTSLALKNYKDGLTRLAREELARSAPKEFQSSKGAEVVECLYGVDVEERTCDVSFSTEVRVILRFKFSVDVAHCFRVDNGHERYGVTNRDLFLRALIDACHLSTDEWINIMLAYESTDR